MQQVDKIGEDGSGQCRLSTRDFSDTYMSLEYIEKDIYGGQLASRAIANDETHKETKLIAHLIVTG